MNDYPGYSGMDKVYFYLGDSYFMMKQYDQAVPYFTKVVTDYSGRKLAKTATQTAGGDREAAKPRRDGHERSRRADPGGGSGRVFMRDRKGRIRGVCGLVCSRRSVLAAGQAAAAEPKIKIDRRRPEL